MASKLYIAPNGVTYLKETEGQHSKIIRRKWDKVVVTGVGISQEDPSHGELTIRLSSGEVITIDNELIANGGLVVENTIRQQAASIYEVFVMIAVV